MSMNLFNILAVAELWKYFTDISNWNPILIIIGCCSLMGFIIFIERLFHLRKSEIDTNKFIVSIRKVIKERNIIEAVSICENTGGPIANIIKAGLLKHSKNKEDIESSMEVQGLIEISQLEKNAKALSILAHITPLIGLLGTVMGFMHAFAEMRESGLMDISATNIGAAMEYALITTAAGLVVAIPAFVAYNYIISRIERFVLEIQTTSSTIVDLLTHHQDGYEF